MASHELLDLMKDVSFINNSVVVEIGSSREVDRSQRSSTRYFHELCNSVGSTFYSVDFSKDSYELAKEIAGESAVHSDGAEFLESLSAGTRIAVLYLDNFDVIYSEDHKVDLLSRVGDAYAQAGEEINNQRAAEVHLGQMEAALNLMADKSVVICDDTLKKPGGWWGKCATVVPFLESKGWQVLHIGKVGCLLVSPELGREINKKSPRKLSLSKLFR